MGGVRWEQDGVAHTESNGHENVVAFVINEHSNESLVEKNKEAATFARATTYSTYIAPAVSVRGWQGRQINKVIRISSKETEHKQGED